ncbi:MAG TPA: hypothetical protein VIF57_04595 [Polyangia bacterium]
MAASSLIRRREIALATVVLAGGCATTVYRPTEPRPVMGPGVQLDVVSVRGAAHQAEVEIRTQQSTLIGPASWSTADREACSATQALAISQRPQPDVLNPLPNAFEVNGAEVVFVELGNGRELAQPGLFLDVKVDTGAAQGCLRAPLTAAGSETLWRADQRPWALSAGLRFDAPLESLEGTGARLSAEFRALFPVGPVRLLYGVILGGASCRGSDCPALGDDGDVGVTGLFFHIGGELGIERRIPLGRWSLSFTAGGSISAFHLGAQSDYMGGQNAGVAGPFASVTLFAPRAEIIPGFAPPARRGTHGPELIVQHLTAFGRGPTENAWALGFGWRIEATQ